jgi:hypothetical protein
VQHVLLVPLIDTVFADTFAGYGANGTGVWSDNATAPLRVFLLQEYQSSWNTSLDKFVL